MLYFLNLIPTVCRNKAYVYREMMDPCVILEADSLSPSSLIQDKWIERDKRILLEKVTSQLDGSTTTDDDDVIMN